MTNPMIEDQAAAEPHITWQRFHPSTDAASGLPKQPGLVQIDPPEGLSFLVRNLHAWIIEMRGQLQASDKPVLWAAPSSSLLLDLARPLASGSPLAQGRPRLCSKPKDAPDGWGLYRIHRKADDTWYVGISGNLRRRLRQHQRNGLLDFESGDTAEVLPAKGSGTDRVVIWGQLQAAEEEHIARLRKSGKAVINVTRGGNGRPPDLPINAPDGSPLRVPPLHASPLFRPRPQHIDLQLRWLRPEQDWDLWLRDDDVICAVPGSHGGLSTRGNPVAWVQLEADYSAAFGRDLQNDLKELQHDRAPGSELAVLYWDQGLRRDATGNQILKLQDLGGIRSSNLRKRSLPNQLAQNGFKIDPEHGQKSSLNQVVRVTRDGSTGAWLKNEENEAARAAELVVSALLHGLRWPGIPERARLTDSGSVVVSPELGSGDIRDCGPIGLAFNYLPTEDASSLIGANRPQSIRKLSIAGLRLADPNDSVRLLVLDAVVGNSDRHSGNLHYGRRDLRLSSYEGFLLPLDHGRCLRNSDPYSPGKAPAAPIVVVSGANRFGNPNQLLRPVAELLRRDFAGTTTATAEWLERLEKFARSLRIAKDWSQYVPELELVLTRVGLIAADPEGFLEGATAGVVAT